MGFFVFFSGQNVPQLSFLHTLDTVSYVLSSFLKHYYFISWYRFLVDGITVIIVLRACAPHDLIACRSTLSSNILK